MSQTVLFFCLVLGLIATPAWANDNKNVPNTADLPGLRKLMDTRLRDTSICRGPDGIWYLTGTVEPFWAYNEGIKVWKSKDLSSWEPLGFVWKYGGSLWHEPYLKAKKPLWAPEIHYLKGTFWLTYSIPGWDGTGKTSGSGLLKSTSGKPEGPYQDVQPHERLGDEIDASLFEDEDGAVYFLWHSGKIARMKPDMSGLAEPYRWLKMTGADPNPKHHSGLCAGIFGKDSYDHVGYEGMFIFKANGLYHLACAESMEGRYSCLIATSKNLFGPYGERYEAIPHGGHNMFFKDDQGQWWSTYFGSDGRAPWQEQPGILPIHFSPEGRVQPGRAQTSTANPKSSSSHTTAWPPITREAKPWTYNWWLASAVDTNNLARELRRYAEAGLGGIHIIPIYGAKGWESNYITYLSPQWMEMLRFTVQEAERLGLGVDMTTGSGWCFGGPTVSDRDANASVVCRKFEVPVGKSLTSTFDRTATQALMAFGQDGTRTDLLPLLHSDGHVDWQAGNQSWRVYAISQKPSGQKVKRAAPGGEGHMLNLFSPVAMTNYLNWFEAAFTRYAGPKPRAQYHDSYEYRSDWAPDFMAQFEQRRGYRLQDYFPALFDGTNNDVAAQVKCDYRETISDIMVENTVAQWAEWSRRQGFLTRNEAHGAPGNLLDLYAVADIPETEMFHKDRNILVAKFAASAAHVTGKRLVSSESCTWLKEHFTETLADVKWLFDDLFLSGVNHLFYHGTCYSPDEAGWPGWLFYASTQMNPRNPIWRDAPAINRYAARCQSVLQAGQPDADILLYWPIHNRWQDARGMVQPMTVHAREWLEGQPIGRAADELWKRGWLFDYVSDRQLARVQFQGNALQTLGGKHRAVVVPASRLIPLPTAKALLGLAEAGATVVFEQNLPEDVPGLAELANRRAELKQVLAKAHLSTSNPDGVKEAKVGKGRVVVGPLEPALQAAGLRRERLVDQPGLFCIRRAVADGRFYFIANRGETPVDGWVPLATSAKSVVLMDPLTGATGSALLRTTADGQVEIRLQLAPGGSMIIKALAEEVVSASAWVYQERAGEPKTLTGQWQVAFIAGGPDLPPPLTTERLGSWTDANLEELHRFGGTAHYTLQFDAPTPNTKSWVLDLGQVAQSARVRLNGKDLGTLITPPFQVRVSGIKPVGNVLEVEVTSTAANRIRDLDRRGVPWRTFRDINFVNIDYKPFDASQWPLAKCGLLGPVTLTPQSN